MNFTLKIWRQKNTGTPGKLVEYKIANITEDMSFLEMLDVLNGELTRRGEPIVAFGHDCREGICGSCALYVNGRLHGPQTGAAVCQLHIV